MFFMMASRIETKTLHIGGMTCAGCQNIIEKALKRTVGVSKAEVRYTKGTATITYDGATLSIEKIHDVIRKAGYEVLDGAQSQTNIRYAVGVLAVVIGLYVLLSYLGVGDLFNAFPLAEAGMGYGMLFVIGLLTSVHCIAMCGGINLSQCIPQSSGSSSGSRFQTMRPSFLYNLGRVISYTVIGGVVGLLGQVVSLSGAFKGAIQLIAGVFMVIMGINMLGIFPGLRRFAPRMPKMFSKKINAQKRGNNSPLYVGLLNGLMPCGPLQAMQLYALSTGNPVQGAASMLVFSLGTVPLMFGLGALSSMLSKKFMHKVMLVGAALVVVLGVSMFLNGWSLSGGASFVPASPSSSTSTGTVPESISKEGVQVIHSTLSSRRYPAITVEVGIPVQWIIDAPSGSINGCNNRMVIPEYGIEHTFESGKNIIEFTPTKAGTFRYSCWMGMIRSAITVVEAEVESTVQESNLIIEKTASADATYTTFSLDAGGGCCAAPIDSQEPAVESSASAEQPLPPPPEMLNAGENAKQTQTIHSTLSSRRYPAITVQAGIPVRWIIDAPSGSINGCNNRIFIPEYGIEYTFTQGENVIEFTPTKEGTFSYSCWMGMIRSSITVVKGDEKTPVASQATQQNGSALSTAVQEFSPAESSGYGCCN